MESYALKDLTLRVFKGIFAEPEFASQPACGLALQAYLKDARRTWPGSSPGHGSIVAGRPSGSSKAHTGITRRVIAQQRRWPVPVFAHKAETDANFEKLSLMLLENEEAVEAAFGTHNVRSIAYVLAQAERLGLDRRSFEFQMLYGMADPIKGAVLGLGCRLREYCPVGELLPGMAYLVRRLLENTSNEGFLANKFAKGASREELLANPARVAGRDVSPKRPGLGRNGRLGEASLPGARDAARFGNEPPTDFTIHD